MAGDLNEQLLSWRPRRRPDAALVVFHSAVMAYLAPAAGPGSAPPWRVSPPSGAATGCPTRAHMVVVQEDGSSVVPEMDAEPAPRAVPVAAQRPSRWPSPARTARAWSGSNRLIRVPLLLDALPRRHGAGQARRPAPPPARGPSMVIAKPSAASDVVLAKMTPATSPSGGQQRSAGVARLDVAGQPVDLLRDAGCCRRCPAPAPWRCPAPWPAWTGTGRRAGSRQRRRRCRRAGRSSAAAARTAGRPRPGPRGHAGCRSTPPGRAGLRRRGPPPRAATRRPPRGRWSPPGPGTTTKPVPVWFWPHW